MRIFVQNIPMRYYVSNKAFLVLCLLNFSFSFGQCPTCGNGIVDAGETELNCPQDISHAATCASPCSQPSPYESVAGVRTALDFVGTTTFSSAGLPVGWSFASAPSATTAGTLAAAGTDAYGAKGGLIQPNCSGSCTATNGFCIGNLANSVAVGGGGTGGKLGANFDGRANISANLSYAVLRGQGNPTLVSPTYNVSGVESFKIQFWLNASETSCGQTNGWGSCVGNAAFLDFSSNGGTSWTQIMALNTSSTNNDMATNINTNTFWIQEGTWSRVCLTLFKSTTSPGNFYPAATASSAPSGMMVNPAYFVSTFKFRVRYAQTASCTSSVTVTNPGRYLAIDYPVVTSGDQCIPCGLSFINMCGYGADNNDDGVGGSGTTTTTVFGTTKRSINQAERGVEILTSQTAAYASQNLTGSNFATNYDLCNAEGGDKQCIDWQSNNNFYTTVYEVLADFETSSVNLQYYKGTTPQSTALTKVTAAGKTPTIGWRYSGNRIVSCGATSDLNPGCNGYSFVTSSLPSQFIRAFYALNTENTGKAYAYYGPSSSSHYFAGPMFAPVARPDTITGSGNYLICNGTDLVFTGIVDYCFNAAGMTGSANLSITGPNGFAETITSYSSGTTPVIDAGEYTIVASTPSSPAQCLNCSRSVCVTVSAVDLTNCVTPLYVKLHAFNAQYENRKVFLNWSSDSEENNDYYELERSVDGVFYTKIAKITGSGTTNQQSFYSSVDEQFEVGKINYYRLKQVDFNGKVTVLKTTSVDCSAESLFTIIPTGVAGEYIVQIKDHSFAEAEVVVYNLMGSILTTGYLKEGTLTLNTRTEKEIVFIQLTTKEASLKQRFWVQ